MARRSYEGTGVLPGIEDEPRSAPERRANKDSPPAKDTSSKKNRPRTRRFLSPRLVIAFATTLVVMGAILFAFHLAEQFLISDPRFALAGSADGSLRIAGAAHASRAAIEKVFSDDEGVSVYLIPLAERRDAVREVPWVREASVARLWPNRVVVSVQERTPVAFVRLNASRFGMIDGDGVILPTAPDRFKLPVLGGVRPADPVANRREGVQRMLRLTSELGDDTSSISEIDVSDGDNIKVSL